MISNPKPSVLRTLALALLIGLITLIGIGGALTVTLIANAAPSNGASGKDAIALAAAHPAFAKILPLVPGWTATAYDSANSLQIWHVEFYTPNKERFGWANVSLVKRRVYSFEAPDPSREPTEAQRRDAEKAMGRYVRENKEIADLVGTIPEEVNVEYNPDLEGWVLGFQQNGEQIVIAVKFSGGRFSLENPQLYGIYFPDMQDYAAWLTSQEARAVNIAFRDARVAEAVRGKGDWIGKATRNEDESWSVVFTVKGSDKALITAQIDLNGEKVLSVVQP